MTDHRMRSTVVVDGDCRCRLRDAVEQNEWKAGRKMRAKLRSFAIGRHDDQAVDTAPESAKDGDHFLTVAVKTRYQEVISRSTRLGIDAADHLGEKLTVQIGEEKADGVRAAQTEASGDSMRREVQGLTGLHHALRCCLAHRTLAVQNSGDGGHRDAGPGGDFFNGDPTVRIPHECNRLHSRRVRYCATPAEVNVTLPNFFTSRRMSSPRQTQRGAAFTRGNR